MIPLLSILIPTVVGREREREMLISKICGDNLHQINGSVTSFGGFVVFYTFMNLDIEMIVYEDNKEITIGEKREQLYNAANGLYSWQIDDDDLISDNAIELILKAIKHDTDCICFKELIDIDGKISHSNISLDYGDWEGDGSKELWDGFSYHRTPFFKTPIKTEICKQVGVKAMRFAEDHDFAQRIKPLLKSMTYIPEFIYHYIHISSPFNLRYGIQ